LSHSFVIEWAQFTIVIDDDRFLSTCGGVGNVELIGERYCEITKKDNIEIEKKIVMEIIFKMNVLLDVVGTMKQKQYFLLKMVKIKEQLLIT